MNRRSWVLSFTWTNSPSCPDIPSDWSVGFCSCACTLIWMAVHPWNICEIHELDLGCIDGMWWAATGCQQNGVLHPICTALNSELPRFPIRTRALREVSVAKERNRLSKHEVPPKSRDLSSFSRLKSQYWGTLFQIHPGPSSPLEQHTTLIPSCRRPTNSAQSSWWVPLSPGLP